MSFAYDSVADMSANLTWKRLAGANSSTENATVDAWLGDSVDAIMDGFLAGLYTYDRPGSVVLIAAYIPLFLLAVSGNIIVLLVILLNRSMRTVTNYFLFNLAIADLLGRCSSLIWFNNIAIQSKTPSGQGSHWLKIFVNFFVKHIDAANIYTIS